MKAIRGGPGSGKTALVFRELKASLRAGKPARLVVPTSTLVRHFQHELARDGEVFPPDTVTTLARFAEPAIPQGVLRAIVREELQRDKSGEFTSVAEADGMVSSLIETIALFENAGASPERLTPVRKLRPAGKAFARLWSSIELRIKALGFLSRPALLRAAANQPQSGQLWFDGFTVFSPLEAEFLQTLAKTCSLTITVSDTTDELWRQTLQWGCESRQLTGPVRRPVTTFVNAASIERETDEIARRIVQLRNDHVAYGDIAIGLRDAETYEPLLRSTLERFGIPAQFYFASPLSQQPAALCLGGLLNCALEGWEFGAALDALRMNPRHGQSAAFDRFDFDVRKAMPGRGTEALLSLCEDERLKLHLSETFSIEGWVLEKRTPSQWSQRLASFAESMFRPGMLDLPKNFADVETLRTQSAALKAWINAVEESTAFYGPASLPVGFSDFWRIASDSVESASVHSRDDRRDVVHVMHAYEARQWDVGTLFLCGVTDRNYPQKRPANLLFNEDEIEAMRKAGIMLRRSSDYERDEDALFETIRGRARDRLVLSWPSHDAGGRRVESSRYVVSLMQNSAAQAQSARLCRPEPVSPPNSPGIPGLIASSDLFTPLADRHRVISVTTLEDLAQCRFKFFAKKTLGLEARPDRPQERIQPRMTGLILHYALEAWLEEGRQGEFVPYFEAAFDETCRKEHLPAGYRLEVERFESRRIAAQVGTTEKWTTEYPPEVEVEISIPLPGGVTISGRVDRVDRISENDCIVVDYKSGKTKRVETFATSPLKLQGPLYALALRNMRGWNTVAMMFHAVREDKRFGWGEIAGVDLGLQPMPERWIEDAQERTVERLTSFLAGRIHAEPAERDQCRWCDFQAACRYEERAVLVQIEGAAGA